MVWYGNFLFDIYGGLLYRPMKKKVKGEGWLTGLSRYNE